MVAEARQSEYSALKCKPDNDIAVSYVYVNMYVYVRRQYPPLGLVQYEDQDGHNGLPQQRLVQGRVHSHVDDHPGSGLTKLLPIHTYIHTYNTIGYVYSAAN